MARLQPRRQRHRDRRRRLDLPHREGCPTGTLELTVSPADAGVRLDAFLTARAGLASRTEAQRLIEAGAVAVGGVRRPKSHRLEAGERVSLARAGEGVSEREPVAVDVVHEDPHLMVVDKPAGLVTHPASGHQEMTLAEVLADRASGGPDPERRGIVHRLDRDTSGLLVVAKTDAAYAALARMLRERQVTRAYLTLVSGHPDAESGTIDAPLGRDRARRALVSPRSARTRVAVTHFKVLERLARTTLLDVRLETGRTHQIRAHLAAIGRPVCGDARYGGQPCGRRLGLERQFLHSMTLMFRHPVTGESLTCESKPPADLRRALDAARREPASGGPDGG